MLLQFTVIIEEEEEEEEMNLLVWLSCRPWKHMYKPDGHRVI